jgi:hypothetical protein
MLPCSSGCVSAAFVSDCVSIACLFSSMTHLTIRPACTCSVGPLFFAKFRYTRADESSSEHARVRRMAKTVRDRRRRLSSEEDDAVERAHRRRSENRKPWKGARPLARRDAQGADGSREHTRTRARAAQKAARGVGPDAAPEVRRCEEPRRASATHCALCHEEVDPAALQ